MLKIKDNIDLKELENFGFIKYLSIDDGEDYYCICKLFIGKDRRILQDDGVNNCKEHEYQLSEIEAEIIFDLHEAGLVEKVEER